MRSRKEYEEEQKFKSEKRLSKIRSKYGEKAFSRWGARGGSPVLKAWKRGQLKIIK